MSRTIAIALIIVLAVTSAAGTVWYVLDDTDDTMVVAQADGEQQGVVKNIQKLSTQPAVSETPETRVSSSTVSSPVVTSPEVSVPIVSSADVNVADETQVIEKTKVMASESTVATSANTSPSNANTKTANIKTADIPGNITDSVEKVDQAELSLSFDIIRVEKSGDTVLAGRAPAGSDVRILDGTTILGSIEADKNGQWVYVLETPLEPGTHELGLEVKSEDGAKIKSNDVAIVNVPKGEESVIAVLVPDENSGVTKVMQLPVKVGEDGIRDGDLALDSIDYDDDGQTIIGGTSQPGEKVVGYLNNEFVGQGVTDASGRWVVEPEKIIEEGLHQLRIDQVDDAGKVIARVEIPFSRSGKIESRPDERIVTVQPGNSLWRISRAIYGQGARYAVIFDRNQDQIRNPDLIYPGQIFVLPKEN